MIIGSMVLIPCPTSGFLAMMWTVLFDIHEAGRDGGSHCRRRWWWAPLKPDRIRDYSPGMAIGLGVGLGVAFGAAFGNVGLGVVLGAAFGVICGAAADVSGQMRARKDRSSPER